MLKNLDISNNSTKNDCKLIGLVSTSKEFKIAWIINNSLDVSLIKEDNEIINLSNGRSLSISHLLYKRNKGFIRLINNKVMNNKGKSITFKEKKHIKINPEQSINETMKVLQNCVGESIPVIDSNNKLIGVISENDVLKAYDKITKIIRRNHEW